MIAASEVAGPLLAQLGAFLALLLVFSAAHKASSWRRARRVMQDFAGVPRSAAGGAALVACVAEVLAGVLLMVPDHRRAGAALGAAIFAVFFALIARAVIQRRGAVDCGCSFGAGRKELGAFEIARNAALLALALVLIASANRAPPIAPSQVLAACALLALYAALDQVMSLQPMRRGTVL